MNLNMLWIIKHVIVIKMNSFHCIRNFTRDVTCITENVVISSRVSLIDSNKRD